MAAQLEMGWRDCVRMIGNPEAIHLDVVANSWNGRGIGREHRSNHREALCGDIGRVGRLARLRRAYRSLPDRTKHHTRSLAYAQYPISANFYKSCGAIRRTRQVRSHQPRPLKE